LKTTTFIILETESFINRSVLATKTRTPTFELVCILHIKIPHFAWFFDHPFQVNAEFLAPPSASF